jgi:hypothetical protein
MARKNKRTRSESNRNARILNRPNLDAMVGGYTFTKGRDADALKVSARTSSSNTTEVVITRFGGDEKLVLSGNEARTLQRALNKHYGDAY